MRSHPSFPSRILILAIILLSGILPGIAGVSRAIQEQYKRDYENKAMFLKIPIYSEKQIIHVTGQGIRAEQGIGAPRFKVGDQLRVMIVDFAGDAVKFKAGGIANPGIVEILFQFDSNLQESFPNKDAFDRALRSTFTEGIKYTDIDEAKRSFVEDQFERSVRDIASSASVNREAVLKNVAPLIPAYQDARRENDNLKDKIQDVSAQLSQAQSENRKLESDARSQQAELNRLRSANAALQDKIDNSTSQISRLGDELKDVRGNAQGYQKELASLQRSLNIKVDATRDLATQIMDLGQAMKKMQKENDSLANQIVSLRNNVESQQAANARLTGDNEVLKSENRKMQSTIGTLTSNKDSLASQYLKLKSEKERLDDFSKSIAAIRTLVVEDKTEGGYHSGKANIFVRNVLLGSLTWNIPLYLDQNESKSGEAIFSAESIDYVRISPEERLLLRSLGDKLKVHINLVSDSTTMAATSESGELLHQIGERDKSSWKWNIKNQGTKDSRFYISAKLINQNSNEIPVFQRESTIAASNAVRQVRKYLQPIPLITGIILGFLLFGIVGIFRRPTKARSASRRQSSGDSMPPPHITQKEL